MSLITLHSSLNILQFSKLTHFVSYLSSYNSKFCIKYWDPFIVLHQNLDWSVGIKICLVISFSFIFFFHFTPVLNFHKKLVLVKFFKLTQSFLLLNWHIHFGVFYKMARNGSYFWNLPQWKLLAILSYLLFAILQILVLLHTAQVGMAIPIG